MKKGILTIALVIGLAVIMSLCGVLLQSNEVKAGTQEDVTITFTPAYLDISNTPSSWDVGTVNTSTNYTTGQGYFTCTNSSSVAGNLTISAVNATWLGGSASTHSDTATAGANTVGLTSSNNTGAYDIIVKNTSPNHLYEDLGAGIDVDWELKFVSATSWVDAVEKSNAARLTISRP